MTMIWNSKHPSVTVETLGYLPQMISDDDPRPAAEQFDSNYRHGGGWDAFKGFRMLPNGDLSYPGDPPCLLLAETNLRDEVIRFYQHSWVAIIQLDGSFEVSRMD